MDKRITELANRTGIDARHIDDAVNGAAQRLVNWFGGEEAAIAALEDDPKFVAGAAIEDHAKAVRSMGLQAMSQRPEFLRGFMGYLKAHDET